MLDLVLLLILYLHLIARVLNLRPIRAEWPLPLVVLLGVGVDRVGVGAQVDGLLGRHGLVGLVFHDLGVACAQGVSHVVRMRISRNLIIINLLVSISLEHSLLSLL